MSSPLLLNRGGVLRRGFIKGSDLALIPSSTPPDNPSAGDLWIYPTGDNGGMWMFVYDTTETTAYKWKFIGGSPIFTHYDYPGGLHIGNSTMTNVTNLSITTARAGDYIFDASIQVDAGAAGTWEWIAALGRNGSASVYSGTEGAAYLGFPEFSDSVGGGIATIAGKYRVEGAAAGDTWQGMAWCSSTGTNICAMGRLTCTPVRVA